jgi:hypothetical protein
MHGKAQRILHENTENKLYSIKISKKTWIRPGFFCAQKTSLNLFYSKSFFHIFFMLTFHVNLVSSKRE